MSKTMPKAPAPPKMAPRARSAPRPAAAPRPPRQPSKGHRARGKELTNQYWHLYSNMRQMAMLNKPTQPHHVRLSQPFGDLNLAKKLDKIGPAAPSYSIFGKPKERKIDDTNPGPGAYEPPNTFTASAPRWAPELATRRIPKWEPPGPGTYNPKLPVGGAPLLAGRLNDPQTAAAKLPGPAEYTVPNYQVGKEGRKFRIAGRLPSQKVKADAPGPGAYEAPSSFQEIYSSKKFAFGARLADPASDKVYHPGPGTYDPPGDFEPEKLAKKGCTIKGREAVDGRFILDP